ncbi:transposase [Mesorhizobium sp.]|uniref:transposase n=1 Tax=Mesorhizobium sp. TaxID=1871066 RepID=UPI00338ECA95
MGLTPKPHSSGGKERLGGISKMGNPTLRSLLVCGATSVLRRVKGTQQSAAMASDPFGAAAFQGRRGRARQQDGEDYLGAAHQGRDISKYWCGKRRSTRLSRTTTRTVDWPVRRRTEARCTIRR